MHCKEHKRDGSKVAEGNQLADCQARKAALYETPSQTPLIYTEEELERYEKRGAKITDKGCNVFINSCSQQQCMRVLFFSWQHLNCFF